MYCWGSSVNGELGLGGIEEESMPIPQKIPFNKAHEIKKVACGENHTLLLSNDGMLYSCGNNDFGQLGHEKIRSRPEMIDALEAHSITKVACGHSHSLAVNEWGQIFSWGSDSYGQLGLNLESKIISQPKTIKSLAAKQVVQIACGYFHSMALTSNGELYTWGCNSHGQLGLGTFEKHQEMPCAVKSVLGIPIAFIACGGNHSFMVSKSGAVFGWGKNTFGQLGVGNLTDACYPTQLKTMRSVQVRYITAGEDHSIFLTKDGGVFSCGAGMYGQLGHGSSNSELLPRKITELMGSTMSQVACGRCHTLALVPTRSRIYAFGVGGAGQLGNKNRQNASTPLVVAGPWVGSEEKECVVREVFAGGDHCFAIVQSEQDGKPPVDFREFSPKSQVLTLTESRIMDFISIQDDEMVDQDLMSYIETVFSSQSCINASFLLPNDEHYCCTSRNPGVDMTRVQNAFWDISRIENIVLKELIFQHLTEDLMATLPFSPPDVEALRLYLILPCFHEFDEPRNYLRLQCLFGQKVLSLKIEAGKIVGIWWSRMCAKYFERLIHVYKKIVLYVLKLAITENNIEISTRTRSLMICLDMLSKLNRLNRDEGLKVPYDTFYIPEIVDTVDVRLDYIRWRTEKDMKPGEMYLCNYPFVFDASAKTLLLQTDQTMQMHQAMNEAASRAFPLLLFTPVSADMAMAMQFLVLTVSRENIVQDTITQLQHHSPEALKRPMKVKFIGEEAEDAGGVRKEFFLFILKEVLDPKYGMFRHYEESHTIWFNEHSFEDAGTYELIGTLCGLAIYNFTIIDLPFPLVLYKKLLGEVVGIDDLKDFMPTVFKSLQALQDYDDNDVEDVFGLRFEITRDVFGEVVVHPLKHGGSDIPVTRDNKSDFIHLYVDFLLNKSVKDQYKQFHVGFHKVCGGRVLELFQAHELMALVVGNENYDWKELEKNAEYKNEYSKDHLTIRLFWEVFHELSLTDKKKFLLFLTGSDRIPILGMKAVKIVIQPTNDDRYLPVAHTCFNLLDLPKYNTKEKLRYKLLQAMQQTQGFYLV